MKHIYLLTAVIILLSACKGSLSDEQRKKMRENMEQGEIKRVTDAELTEAAFEYGRAIISEFEKKGSAYSSKSLIDSIQKAYDVKIISLQVGDSALMEIEKQIIEAYTSDGNLEVSDNIQNIGADSLLYTKPIMRERADGSLEFVKAVGIHLPKRRVVLSIKD